MTDHGAWVDERLAAAGIVRTGELVEHRGRLWATVSTAPTDHGPVWFKQAAPMTGFEAGLYALLAEVAPGRVLEPIALDTDRGWMLLPDTGPTIGQRFTGDALVAVLSSALRQYARLQLDVTPYADDLVALGVADMRPDRLPEHFDEAVAAVAPYVEAVGTDEQRAGYDAVVALRAEYQHWCERLAAAPQPASLDHNDLHESNIVGSGPAGRFEARFYDWGASVVAHPFACLLVPLMVVGAEHADRLRDAYLTEFTAYGNHDDLAGTARLACRTAQVARALVWQRAVSAESYDHEFADAPLEHLCYLLDPPA